MRTRIPGRKRTASRHDQGYKRLFSHPSAVEHLLRGFLREDWADRLDFSSLERVGNSFVSDDLRERHSDVIWRLRFQGKGQWLYLLLELQSTSHHFMAVRLQSYAALLQEEVIRREKLRTRDPLPLVLPVVFYNGERPWRAPREMRSLYREVQPGLRHWLPDLRYLVLDVRRLDLNRPELAGNWVAALLRIEACPNPDDLHGLAEELASMLPPEDSELRRTITIWLNSIFHRALPGAIIPLTKDTEGDMLEQTVRKWGELMMARGMRKLVLQLLTQRFGRLSAPVRRQVEAISTPRELSSLHRKIVTARTLQETGLG
ncbi:MAG TPA: Rpn family recombination-promoting nuclease/putative transposase [Thermoanaerobaculia bacterium]